MVYFSLAFPHLFYGTSAWRGSCKNVIKPVHVLQKGIVRAVNGDYRQAHAKDLFLNLYFMNFEHIVHYVTCTYVHRALRNPVIRCFVYESLQRRTRRADLELFSVLFTSLECCTRNILYGGPNNFNSLTFPVRNASSCDCFKARLKKTIFESDV